MRKIKIQDNHEINVELVSKLISEQFPQWSCFTIKKVEPGGHDNRTFRLGCKMTLRLPSAEAYAAKVKIEQTWLPILASQLSIEIPQPIAMGQPTNYFPWHWSIYKWIEGVSANNLSSIEINQEILASQLGIFLNELHKADIKDAPIAGPHNFYRGGDLAIYNHETIKALEELKDIIDSQAAQIVWAKALNSKWHNKPVWIHGDLSSGNILIKNKILTAVIDFGGMSVGDPACDLVISWTFFKDKSRKIFQEKANLDSDTWNRARGWALWKSLITLNSLKDKSEIELTKQKQIINDIIKDSNF